MRHALVLAALLLPGSAAADSLHVLHHFAGPDGQSPTGLIQASDGKLYGVGANGGDQKTCDPDGCGVVFSLGLDGSFTKLHDFHTDDGYQPTGLVEGGHGKFYGTTFRGGAESGGGGGVLYSITSAGKFKILAHFGDGFVCCGPAMPSGHLIKANDGNYYGTSQNGGDFRDVDHGNGLGTVYRFDPMTNAVTVVHSFTLGDSAGIHPFGPLTLGKDGALYGTTRENESGGAPSVFRIDIAGNFSVVGSLPNTEPVAGVIQSKTDGNFYGTDDGGPSNGSLFRVNGKGKVTFINRFDRADGKGPRHQLTPYGDGFFFGSALEGGLLDPQGGSIFRIDAGGDLRVLHSFDRDETNGILPNATLVLASDGSMYGTGALGGSNARGTVFAFDPNDLGAVQSVSFDKARVKSGRKAHGTVTLFAPADHDTIVHLGATPGPVTVPQTVVVKAGEQTAGFNAKTFQIGAKNETRVYASVAGQGTRTILTVVP
jgi:uncharacterized repeat protein (TIGR03803 family)